MARRIAVVQHGDYAQALRIIGRGQPEPYFGMAYTLCVLRGLFGGSPHLVVSLDAPAGRDTSGNGVLVGLPVPKFPLESISEIVRARRVRAELQRFEPTHILLRASGFVAIDVLEYARVHGSSTLAVFANVFDDSSWVARHVNRRLGKLLRQPCVFLVGNHKEPATRSMIAWGVSAENAVAWDWPNARHPRDNAPKVLREGGEWRVVYVGSVSEAKGVGDLVEAVRILRDGGMPASLDVAGDGPALDSLRERASALGSDVIRFLGRIGNDEAFRLMMASSLVCVPSRHEFSEGMPLTLTEALASRTPVVISDHPVFASFVDGEGVRVFSERDPSGLARVIREVMLDPHEYARLSLTTLDAFRRVECTTYFGDLITRWKASFESPLGGNAVGR